MTACQTCGAPVVKVDGAWQHWNDGRLEAVVTAAARKLLGDHEPVPERPAYTVDMYRRDRAARERRGRFVG